MDNRSVASAVRRRRTWFGTFAGLAVGGLVVGCSGAPMTPADQIATLQIVAGLGELAVGGQLDVDVVATTGSGQDVVPLDLTWHVSDGSLASIDVSGALVGLDQGDITVTASAGGRTASIDLTVRGFLLGAAGGIARSLDGSAEVVFAPGALTGEDIVVTVELASPSDVSGLPSSVSGTAHLFEPSDLSLAAPIEVRIAYDAAAIQTDMDPSTLRLVRAEAGGWTNIAGSTLDQQSETVRAFVSTLGTLALTGDVTNQSPSVAIGAPSSASSFLFGAPVMFVGVGTDPEDGTLPAASLTWSSNLDGTLGTGSNFTTSSLSIGSHSIVLRGVDSGGESDTDNVAIDILNNDPVASITAPADAAILVSATGITFTGSATDVEDGSVSGAGLVWTSDVDGQIGTGASFTTSTLSVGAHTITLVATDSHAGTDSAQINITVI